VPRLHQPLGKPGSAEGDRNARGCGEILPHVLHPHQEPGKAVLLIQRLCGRDVMPVLQAVHDSAATDTASRHRVDPAMDRVVVAAEQAAAELLVAQTVVEQRAGHRHDLSFPDRDAHGGKSHQRVRLPGDAQHLARRATTGKRGERRGSENRGGVLRRQRPLCPCPCPGKDIPAERRSAACVVRKPLRSGGPARRERLP
jgi:hypothetical protein